MTSDGNTQTPAPVITIDGPSGSGKGTLTVMVAQALGWHTLDSGALYRIVGVACERSGIPLEAEREEDIAKRARELNITFSPQGAVVDGEPYEDAIRTEEGGAAASKVAAMPQVRLAVHDLQLKARRVPGLVADGRDMGTFVFPDAELKVFLDASAEERAERRYKQLKNKGLSVSLPALLEQIRERDARDTGRTVAPLKPAEDALIIDSTSMSIEAVFDQVMEAASERGFAPSA